jgi:3-oxoacyl-[acyl-carrier-protein] synthase III
MEQNTHLPDETVRFGASIQKRTLKSIKLLQVDLGMDERFSVASERNSATMELLVKCATALLQEAKAENRDPDHGFFVEWLANRTAAP